MLEVLNKTTSTKFVAYSSLWHIVHTNKLSKHYLSSSCHLLYSHWDTGTCNFQLCYHTLLTDGRYAYQWHIHLDLSENINYKLDVLYFVFRSKSVMVQVEDLHGM